MSIFVKLSFSLILLLALIYFAFPSPPFPKPPVDSVQSLEEADVEDAWERRAYFTNFSREEVLTHYKKELQKNSPIKVPSYRVIYPPEDAQTLIRDQTRSVHLPEIIHPGRESLFVNFFEPKSPKDEIWYKGVHYERKITVRYIPTPTLARIAIIPPAFLFLLYLVPEVLTQTLRTVKLALKK